LELEGVSEEDEETEKVRLRYNMVNQANPELFKRLRIKRPSNSDIFKDGTFWLRKMGGDKKIRVWEKDAGGQWHQITFQNQTVGGQSIPTVSWGFDSIPAAGKDLWIEGIAKSGPKEVVLRLDYKSGQYSGSKLASDTVCMTLVNLAVKLEQVGNTVINAQNNYSEDTTIRVTAVDETNGMVVNWFTGDVTIAELPAQNNVYVPIYNQNGGVLPPSVKITAGGTVTFVAQSLAGPDTSKVGAARKPEPAKIKCGNFPVYGAPGYLSVPQWIDLGQIHELANPGVPDWLELRTLHFFFAHPEDTDVGKVLRSISCYWVDWLEPVDGLPQEANAGPNHGQKGTVIFNPYNDSELRLNADWQGRIYCFSTSGKRHYNTILHEARHCYQGIIADNANDQD
jgi:hypothetical protein